MNTIKSHKNKTKNKLSSSINSIIKFKPSDARLASTCGVSSTKPQLMETGKNLAVYRINSKDESPSSTQNKFKQRRGAVGSKFNKNIVEKVNENRYDMDTSSFLESILDCSSTILFQKQKSNKKQLPDVRKKFTQSSKNHGLVLFDGSKDNTDIPNKFMQDENSNTKYEDSSLVNINNEIDSYLKNDKSIVMFKRDSIDSELEQSNAMPCFKQTKATENETEWDSDNSSDFSANMVDRSPEMPLLSNPEPSNINGILDQIVVISEMIQPSEDDLANRMLSYCDDPLSINYNIDSNKFEVDYKLVPKNGLLRFKPKADIQ